MPQNQIGRQGDAPVRPGTALGKFTAAHDDTYTISGKAAKIVEITVDNLVDNTDFGFASVGEDGLDAAIGHNSGAGATKTTIRDGLVTGVENNAGLMERVYPYDSASDKLRLEGRRNGDNFPVEEADANLSLTIIQAASDGQPIPFGAVVMKGLGRKTCELPSVTAGLPRIMTVALANLAAGDILVLAVGADLDGNGIAELAEARIVLDGDPTIQEAVEAFKAQLDAQLPGVFSTSEDDLLLTITGPSGIPFEMMGTSHTAAGAQGNTTFALEEIQAHTERSLTRPLLGVTLRAAVEADLPDQDIARFKPGEDAPVRRFGEAAFGVEPGVNPVEGDPVYLRVIADGEKAISQLTNVPDGERTFGPLKEFKWTEGARGKWGKIQVATAFVNTVA